MSGEHPLLNQALPKQRSERDQISRGRVHCAGGDDDPEPAQQHSGIDWVADFTVRTGQDQLVFLLESHGTAPVAAQDGASPNGEEHPGPRQYDSKQIQHFGWRKPAGSRSNINQDHAAHQGEAMGHTRQKRFPALSALDPAGRPDPKEEPRETCDADEAECEVIRHFAGETVTLQE